MIKAEDLRIGDLVQTNKDCMFPKDTVCIVTEIHSNRQRNEKKRVATLKAINDDDDGPLGTWCCNIDGVPVTPEILEKNEFEVIYPGKCYKKPIVEEIRILSRYLSFEYKHAEWKIFMKYDALADHALLCSVKYVHELQHVLWALGENAKLNI